MSEPVKIVPKQKSFYENYSRVFGSEKSTKHRLIVQYRYTYKYPIHGWIESTGWTSKDFYKCCVPVDSILLITESRQIEYNE